MSPGKSHSNMPGALLHFTYWALHLAALTNATTQCRYLRHDAERLLYAGKWEKQAVANAPLPPARDAQTVLHSKVTLRRSFDLVRLCPDIARFIAVSTDH